MEQLFLCMCYLGMDYAGAYNLPIQYRIWYIRRLQEEMKKQADSNEEGSTTTRPSYEGLPEHRAMTGRGVGRRRF